MKSNIEAFLMVAAHHPQVAALVYTDKEAALALAQQEFEIELSPTDLIMLKSITNEALTAAIAAAKNADQIVEPRYERTRGIRPDIPIGKRKP